MLLLYIKISNNYEHLLNNRKTCFSYSEIEKSLSINNFMMSRKFENTQ